MVLVTVPLIFLNDEDPLLAVVVWEDGAAIIRGCGLVDRILSPRFEQFLCNHAPSLNFQVLHPPLATQSGCPLPLLREEVRRVVSVYLVAPDLGAARTVSKGSRMQLSGTFSDPPPLLPLPHLPRAPHLLPIIILFHHHFLLFHFILHRTLPNNWVALLLKHPIH